jgi:uncharacterized membrane protein YhhN
LHYVTKPAILVSLIAYFLTSSNHLNKTLKLLTLFALLFSLLGDVLLMFVHKSEGYFMFGLIAFLLAHIMYIIVFLKHKNPNKNPYVFTLIALLYAAILFYIMFDGLGDMLYPVTVYMLVILTMAITAFLRQGKVLPLSYTLVFLGALLFMLSDSILALNKFYKPLPLSNISIMLTYALAQYFIVLGLLKNK